jgi:hypothetical protein
MKKKLAGDFSRRYSLDFLERGDQGDIDGRFQSLARVQKREKDSTHLAIVFLLSQMYSLVIILRGVWLNMG